MTRTTTVAWLLVALGAGCATGSSAPEPRATGCQVRDVSIPPGTSFSVRVPVEVGRVTLASGDALELTEVWGTQPRLQVDGLYLVRGRYTLASADRATLRLYVTALDSGEGCTTGHQRATQALARGAGTFELASALRYRGHPHLRLEGPRGPAGDVYFGQGDWLLR